MNSSFNTFSLHKLEAVVITQFTELFRGLNEVMHVKLLRTLLFANSAHESFHFA